MIEHSFAPFTALEASLLSNVIGIDYTHTNFDTPRWLCVSGREDGDLLGMCCFEFKNHFDAHFSIAIRDRRCINRRVMRAMFTAVFSRAKRVTAHLNPNDSHAILGARRMGFQPEGYQRLMIEGTRDAFVMGMLAEDCVYLPRRPRLPASFPLTEVNDDGQHSLAS